MTRLADLLHRFGEAIAADLAEWGWDVVELWQAGRFAFTLNMVDHLPRTSAYAHATAEDEEFAAEVARSKQPQADRPSTTEWSRTEDLLASIHDRLADVAQAPVVAAGGKYVRARPYPRPVTAIDRARRDYEQELVDRATAKAFPNHTQKEG